MSGSRPTTASPSARSGSRPSSPPTPNCATSAPGKSPGQNGSRERGFGTLKYEQLFLEEIDDVLDQALHAERYRVDYNTVRPHEALSWNRPHDVHVGLADPAGAQLSRARNPANHLTRDTATYRNLVAQDEQPDILERLRAAEQHSQPRSSSQIG